LRAEIKALKDARSELDDQEALGSFWWPLIAAVLAVTAVLLAVLLYRAKSRQKAAKENLRLYDERMKAFPEDDPEKVSDVFYWVQENCEVVDISEYSFVAHKAGRQYYPLRYVGDAELSDRGERRVATSTGHHFKLKNLKKQIDENPGEFPELVKTEEER
jgi:flagellar biosynthesis/type III secretory pathway M-ring protein FliF/YscJ